MPLPVPVAPRAQPPLPSTLLPSKCTAHACCGRRPVDRARSWPVRRESSIRRRPQAPGHVHGHGHGHGHGERAFVAHREAQDKSTKVDQKARPVAGSTVVHSTWRWRWLWLWLWLTSRRPKLQIASESASAQAGRYSPTDGRADARTSLRQCQGVVALHVLQKGIIVCTHGPRLLGNM